MNSSLLQNFITLAISVVALTTTMFLTLRQIRLATFANHLPVVLEAFKETRGEAWLDAEDYVLNRLASEHPADGGWHNLPEPARSHVTKIALFYDDLGKVVAHGVINQSLVIGSYGTNIVLLWDALAPYVYSDRHAHGTHSWVYFEDLAVRTASTHPQEVYRSLGLKYRRPRQEPDAVRSGLLS